MPHSVQVGDFESLRDQWEGLLPQCANDTTFVTPWWQETWWRHFGSGKQLSIMSVHAGERVVGVAPMMASEGTVAFLGGTDLFDYHEFVVAPDDEEAFFKAVCDHLLTLDWHTVDLRSISQDSPTLKRFPALMEERGVKVEVTEEDKVPLSMLPSSWEGYVAGLSKKSRHELRRKLRRLEAADSHRQYCLLDPDAVAEGMPDFFRLLRSSGDEKREFLTPEREAFFVDAAHQLAARGQLRLYFLEVGGTRAAACICFDYAGSYFLYNSGYDPAFASLSVGLLNKALCIRDAIQEGRRSFEFLRGTERYKYDLGAEDRTICRVLARR